MNDIDWKKQLNYTLCSMNGNTHDLIKLARGQFKVRLKARHLKMP